MNELGNKSSVFFSINGLENARFRFRALNSSTGPRDRGPGFTIEQFSASVLHFAAKTQLSLGGCASRILPGKKMRPIRDSKITRRSFTDISWTSGDFGDSKWGPIGIVTGTAENRGARYKPQGQPRATRMQPIGSSRAPSWSSGAPS